MLKIACVICVLGMATGALLFFTAVPAENIKAITLAADIFSKSFLGFVIFRSIMIIMEKISKIEENIDKYL